jgi:uncharacterized protein YbjT (DUF2867 family)
MFTVFGANGNTGSVVARTLLDRGANVRVVVRTPAKVASLAAAGAEVVTGDVEDAASIESALRGASGAYLLLPPAPASNDFYGRGRRIVANFRAALEKAPVAHAALLSSVAAHVPSGTGPILSVHVAEHELGSLARTRFTFVRAAYFMENLLNFGHPMKNDGVLPVFGGGNEYPFPMVATADIGRVAAEALLAAAPAKNQVIELSGPSEYSFDDAAREASRILGRPVKAAPMPIDALVPALTSLGMSANVAGLYREMTEAFGNGTARFEGGHRTVRGTVELATVLGALASS